MDAETRLLRYRVVEGLVLLAAPAVEQIEYMDTHGWKHRIELLIGFMNWEHELLPRLDRDGALSPEALNRTEAVNEALVALGDEFAHQYPVPEPILALRDDGIRTDPRWEMIRSLARQALDAFGDLGVPIPRLLDEDYNIRRQDAP